MENIKKYLSDKEKQNKLIAHIFKRFLLQHNCYEAFRKEYNEGYRTLSFTHAHPDLKHCGFSLFLANVDSKTDLIDCAFLWRETEQGDNFWFDLSSEWVSFCDLHYSLLS